MARPHARKHSCAECSTETTGIGAPDPWWAEDKRFVIIARQIHVGRIDTVHATDDAASVSRYMNDWPARCSSHELFAVVDRGQKGD